MIDDNTLKESKTVFVRRNKQREFVTVSHVNNDAQIFDIVALVALVFNVSQIQIVEKDGEIIRLWKARLKNATDDISLTLFGSMFDVTEEKSSYMFTDLRLSKYKFTRLLKTTKSAKITSTGGECRKF